MTRRHRGPLIVATVLSVAVLMPYTQPDPAAAAGSCGPLPEDIGFYQDMVVDRPDGWLGADLTGTVRLAEDRVLWLFGDTDWGERTSNGVYLPGWQRTTNSAFLQTGSCVEAIGNPLTGDRVGLADPGNDDLYWPGSGWVHGDRLFVAFTRLEKTGAGVFGFERIRNELVEFTLDLTPVSTQVLPDIDRYVWGESLHLIGDEVYWWGNGVADESKVFGAKSPVDDPMNLTYWDGSGWNPSPTSAAVVHQRPGQADNATFGCFPGDRWLAVSVDDEIFTNGELVGWLADDPMGPYVPLGPIADLPERREGTNEFTYLATVHHCLDLPGTSGLLSVSIGSFEAWEVLWGLARNWPQFSVLRLEPRGEPLQGDFDDDGYEDVFWYAPGSTPDWIWWGGPDDIFTNRLTTNVSGTYEPVAGDFDGDGRDDILWYRPGPGGEYLWSGRADRSFDFGSGPSASGTYRPVSGDFDGDTRDDVFWYAAGPNPDYVWSGRQDRGFTSRPTVNVRGTYVPFTGDFDGDTRDDVFWYGPGTVADHIWTARADRTFASTPTSVAGVYVPIVGDFDLNGRDDVFWYVPGGGHVWYEVPAGVSIPCNGICVAGVD